MKRSIVAVAIGALVIAAGSNATNTPRHMQLVRSVPGSDTTVTRAPSSIQLWFSEAPQAAVSRIWLARGEEDLRVGETRANRDSSLVVDVPTDLQTGSYTVRWRTAGDDGHVLRDTFQFTIAGFDDRP